MVAVLCGQGAAASAPSRTLGGSRTFRVLQPPRARHVRHQRPFTLKSCIFLDDDDTGRGRKAAGLVSSGLAMLGSIAPPAAYASLPPPRAPPAAPLTLPSSAPVPPAWAGEAGVALPSAPALWDDPASPLPPLPTEFPPLPAPAIVDYEEITLKNGLRLFLVEDHELGVVNGQMLMKGGFRGEAKGLEGVAGLAVRVQRSGGTLLHDPDALDSRLEELAASVEMSAANGAITAGFDCLTEDLPEVLGLFAEVLQQPALPAERLEVARSRTLDAIEHRNDSGDAVAARKLRDLLYGKGTLAARDENAETVGRVTVADLRAYVDQWERPDQAVLGISGDFDAKKIRKLVDAKLGGWAPAAGQPAAPPALPTPSGPWPENDGTVHLVDIPGLTQSYVALGELGVQLRDPDTYKLDVLNGILNGFGGRLFNEVRSKGGLAYTVSGGWSPKLDYPGVFVGSGSTNQPARLAREVQRVVQNTAVAEPSEEELAAAKESALNRFIFNFADPGQQLSRIISYDLFGLPQDLIFTYKDQIEATSAADVLEVAQRRVHVPAQAVVVVGDAKSVRGELKKAGFTVVDMPLEP